MIKKIINLFYIILFLIFVSLVSFFYFSENNVIKVNKSRYLYSDKLEDYIDQIPLLKNDTHDSIEYTTTKKKKYNLFWNLINE